MDAKHPKSDNLPESPPHPSYNRSGQPVHDMFSVVDEGGPADGRSAVFGSSLAAAGPDGLAGDAAFSEDEGDDSLFGGEDGGYLFGGMNIPHPDEGPGDGSFYGGIDAEVDDDVIVYNPSDAADGAADMDFLLVRASDGAKIDDVRPSTASARDNGAPDTDAIIYGENVAGLATLEALADIGITVDGARISVDDHDRWVRGDGNAHSGYTTFTGSDKEGHKLTLELLTAALKDIETAG